LWAALFLLVIEVALEVRAIGRGYGGVLLHRGAGVSAPATSATPEFGPTPEFPFRSRITTPADAQAATSLWLASSSYGEDIYVWAQELFATRLADAIDQPVLNASHGGTTIASNQAELEERGPTYKPDIVLLYQMSNDIDLISERFAAGLPAGATPGAGSATGQSFAPVSPWIQSMTTYRQLKSHATSRLAEHLPLWDDLDQHTPPGSPTAVESFAADVEAFVDATLALGAKPVLITFATAYGPGEADQIPGEIARQNLAMNIVLSPTGWTRAIATFNDTLRTIAAERGLVCIDLASEMRGRAELFRDLWHLTPKGHAHVAELLEQALVAAFPELAP
jgi:hypothetical protein